MSLHSHLLLVWLTMTALGVTGLALALLWAIRSGQFQQQDRARYLPLESHVPDDQEWAARPQRAPETPAEQRERDDHAPG